MEAKAESFADQLLDELLPEELEWRRLVGHYPWAVLGAAAALGYFLGRRHGEAVVGAASGLVASGLTSRVASLLGDTAV